MVLEYPGVELADASRQVIFESSPRATSATHSIGVLGAGNFARMVLVPAIQKSGSFRLKSICSAGGTSAAHTAEEMGFEAATTDEDSIFNDSRSTRCLLSRSTNITPAR